MFHEFLTVTNSSMKKWVPNHAIMISCALIYTQAYYANAKDVGISVGEFTCPILWWVTLHHQNQPNRIDTQQETECSMRIKQQRPSTNKTFMLIVFLWFVATPIKLNMFFVTHATTAYR